MTTHWCISAFALILLAIHPECEANANNAQLQERCGPHGFYCRSNSSCVARRFRCPSNNDRHWRKAYHFCPMQDHCHVAIPIPSSPLIYRPRKPVLPQWIPVSNVNRFFILTAFSPIYRTGSRSRRRRKRGVVDDVWRTLIKDPWMHSFIQYRGFVYEFGSYGVHELDINDPDYKYNRESSTGWSRIGTSICHYTDIKRFLNEWKEKHGKYSWYSNNCHSFTKALVKYLKNDCRDLIGATPGVGS